MANRVMKIPAQGLAGLAQQTLVGQALGSLTSPRTRKKRRKSAAAARPKRRKATASKKRSTARRSTKKPARLVKGSRAAKAYMARIRKMRGKKRR